MKGRPQYRRGGRRPSHSRRQPLRIKPQADAALKKVFAGIGTPPRSEFKPDPFQLEAVAASAEADCLVTAPTGAGKTWIAQQAIRLRLQQGKKSWYASPLKALSNAKYQEFSDLFGSANTGILTGDRKENPEAPVIIGTTEILRNQLYDAMHFGEMLDTDLVVLDEAHFLGDEDRGVVWEEIMIYLPNRIPLLMLSATIGNADQIADWLNSIRSRKCIVVKEIRRPVPLFHLFLHPSGTLLPLLDPAGSKRGGRVSKKVRAYLDSKIPRRIGPARKLPPFGQILKILKQYNLLPAIFFLKSRADCDKALERCSDHLLTDPERSGRLAKRIFELGQENAYIRSHRQLPYLEQLAVGAHHSGQLPAWKLVLERLMTEGLLDAIFATSTVAAGVNFPARTIVFLNSDRYNGREFVPLGATEFHQTTGRAGRRGMDRIGFALTIPGRFMDLRLMARLVTARPSYVLSQIKINFSMVLNLLLSHTPEQIEALLEKSFATYLINCQRRKKKIEFDIPVAGKNLWHDFQRHLSFLKDNGYVDSNDRLTEDGHWAAQLRVDQPLMIAEAFRRGIFSVADPVLLAAIVSLFVNEEDPDDQTESRHTPKRLLRAYHQIRTHLDPFAKQMLGRGFSARPIALKPALALFAWAKGQPWHTVAAASELAEGNLAMLIFRTADNLRHIRSLKAVFPEIAQNAADAVDLLIRDPLVIDYEWEEDPAE